MIFADEVRAVKNVWESFPWLFEEGEELIPVMQ